MTANGGPGHDVILNVQGDRVGLGPRRADLAPVYQRWINDFEVTRTLALSFTTMTLEAERAWLAGLDNVTNAVTFTIYELATRRPIGNTDLRNIDHRHGTAEFGIMIGEKDCWNRGYGTETARLMLDYGFSALGLHNVMLQAYAYNERGLGAYRRAGFREFGRRREARRLGHRAYDIVFMDCLSTEFTSTALHRLMAGDGG
ncbi:MAG: GNAT family protein [Dehalococcoidia bacterium]